MAEIGHQTDAINYAAQNSKLTTDEVADVVDTIQEALETQLYSLYETAWKYGLQTHITEFDSGKEVVFAHSQYEWRQDYLSDVELTDEEFFAVLAYHQYLAREIWGFAVQTRTQKTADHFPIFIKKPLEWKPALDSTALHFHRLFMFNLTPTEALDYWLCELRSWDRETIAGWRDVDRAAVNKSIRQAKEKLEDYDSARGFYEERGTHQVPMSELGEDAHFDDPDVALRSTPDETE